MLTADDLKRCAAFSEVSLEDLNWMVPLVRVEHFEEGDTVREYGAPAEEMIIGLDGAFEFFMRHGNRWDLWRRFEAGMVTGLLPYSRMETYPGRTIMMQSGRMGFLDKSHFQEMLFRMPTAGQYLVEQLSDRIRRTTTQDKEIEKMMALGRLSAGLAHELNNPASAVKSAADALQQRLTDISELVAGLSPYPVSQDELQAALSTITECERATDLSTLQRGALEDELSDWLEEFDVPDSWRIAPSLVECGVTLEHLVSAVGHFESEVRRHIVLWLEAQLASHGLVQDIQAASERISTLIGSVKTFSHMDRDPSKQSVDIRKGLESTLTMLGSKIRQKDLSLHRDYVENPPDVQAFPGELNQVWTNLIDNAIDALPKQGELRVSTAVTDKRVVVKIADNGSGIPKEVQPRVFEPFFTTKTVGEGTGLGLDISKRIIEEKHGGTISFESAPGRTVFTVSLKFD